MRSFPQWEQTLLAAPDCCLRTWHFGYLYERLSILKDVISSSLLVVLYPTENLSPVLWSSRPSDWNVCAGWCFSLLTILVLPSGPQYEVTMKGEIVPEDSGKPSIPSAAVCASGGTSHVPPILSNKQLVAWGGVTLGRAM